MSAQKFILNFSAPCAEGQVFAISHFLQSQKAYIDQLEVFEDSFSKHTFMRVVFREVMGQSGLAGLRQAYEEVFRQFKGKGNIWLADEPVRVLLMGSKTAHCLRTLISAAFLKEINMKIVGVVSNHEILRPMVEQEGLDYYYLPVNKENRRQQEQEILNLIEKTDAEFVVLARYMQILSDSISARLYGRAINIHHSFLPGFKGANPYQQAYDRGVKLIGATAHFVTPDLDEGPIIEQSVERVDHAYAPDQLLSMGRHVESAVLERALRYVIERRVFINGNRTVILR